MVKEYALTVKKTRQPCNECHYNEYLSYLLDNVSEIGNVRLEHTKGLHLHCVIKTNGELDYKDLYPAKYGWNVKAVPLYNRQGWIKYTRKDDGHNVKVDCYKDSDLYDDFRMPNHNIMRDYIVK